jgi:hypothetical protein
MSPEPRPAAVPIGAVGVSPVRTIYPEGAR